MAAMLWGLVVGFLLGVTTARWRDRLGGAGPSIVGDGPVTAVEWVVLVTFTWPLLALAGALALLLRLGRNR